MLIWYGASTVAAIAIAWLASLVHASGSAPVGLTSLAVGIGLGVALSRIAAAAPMRPARRHLIIGAILLAIVTIIAEHTWLYLDFRRQWSKAREQAQVAIFRPESPWSLREFFANQATSEQITVWCVDAAVILTSTLGTVVFLTGKPTSDPPASNS